MAKASAYIMPKSLLVVLNLHALFAVDWILFSKVFETLVRLMNALSPHFTSRLDQSAVSNPLPEIPLDWVKSSR